MARKQVAKKPVVEQSEQQSSHEVKADEVLRPTKKAAKMKVDRPVPPKKERKRKLTLEGDQDEESAIPITKAKKRKITAEEDEEVIELSSEVEIVEQKAKKHHKRMRLPRMKETIQLDSEGEPVKRVKKKRQRGPKKEKSVDAMPIATRTAGHKLLIGAHVSAAGGVEKSVANSVHIGGNAFALFLKSQRKWAYKPLPANQCTSFHVECKSHSYDQSKVTLPHGSYLVNLAHTDVDRTTQAFDSFLDDLKRCESLGIKLYNFHPGVANSTGGDRQAAIAHLASNLNRAHTATSTVVTVLENMATGGNTLGSTFEDLRDIIALIKDKKRIGVCLDTCHTFAGGYDLRTPAAFKKTMNQFEKVVGFKYLRAMHINDSKAPLSSHRDLHANIGTGFLGLRSFHNIVNDSRFEGLPLILETPLEVTDEDGIPVKDQKDNPTSDAGIWAREIKLLESLVGMDTEGEEFLGLEEALAKKGEAGRAKMSEQMEKKLEKEEKKSKKEAKKLDQEAKKLTLLEKKPNEAQKEKKKIETESEAEDSAVSEVEGDGELNGDT